MRLRSCFVIALLVAAAAGGYWAWNRSRVGPPNATAGPDPANTLCIDLGAEPGTLDPALARTLPETLLVLALFEGLYAFDPKTVEPRPALAASAETSADGRRWTFRLREARWTNGDRVTAEDFVWSWTRARSQELRAPYAHLFALVAAAHADGEGTLVVELTEPAPWLPSLLCFPPFLPVHRATVDSAEETWCSPARIVSNGPFSLRSRRWHDSLLLEKSPTYRCADDVKLAGVRLLTSTPPSRALEQFDAGEIDWVWTVPAARVAALRSRGEWSSATRLSVRFLRFNTRAAPFQESRLRRAVSLAIDRDELVRTVPEAPAHSLVPPGFPGYEPAALTPDKDKALGLLDDAGYPRGAGLPPVDLAFPEGETALRLAKAVAARLRATLGMDVRPVPLGKEGAFRHMRLSLHGAEVLDPWTFLSAFTSGHEDNLTGWRSGWYDELVSQASLASDPAARMDLYRQAERVLVQDEAPVAPLSFPREGFLLRPRVKGVWANGLGVHPLRDVWIEPPAGNQ